MEVLGRRYGAAATDSCSVCRLSPSMNSVSEASSTKVPSVADFHVTEFVATDQAEDRRSELTFNRVATWLSIAGLSRRRSMFFASGSNDFHLLSFFLRRYAVFSRFDSELVAQIDGQVWGSRVDLCCGTDN